METGQATAPDNTEAGILARIQGSMYPQETQAAQQPRAPDGKFVSQQAEPEPPVDPTPVPEGQDEGGEEPAQQVQQPSQEPEQQEEVSWEDLKEYKLKIPMKAGDREWEEEITLAQLRDERLMRNDYNRRLEEFNAQKAQLENQRQAEREQLRQAAIAELATYEQALFAMVAPQFRNVDMNALAQQDPAQWAAMQQYQQNFNQTLYALRQQRQQLEGQQQNEQMQARQRAAEAATQRLAERIPGWNADLDKSLAETAVETYGFRADELAAGFVPIADARTLEIMHDAYQWRQLQAQKPLTTKKVVEAPKVLKPGAKRDPGADRMRAQQELHAVVRKTGGKGEKGEAALAAFLKQRMFGG